MAMTPPAWPKFAPQPVCARGLLPPFSSKQALFLALLEDWLKVWMGTDPLSLPGYSNGAGWNAGASGSLFQAAGGQLRLFLNSGRRPAASRPSGARSWPYGGMNEFCRDDLQKV